MSTGHLDWWFRGLLSLYMRFIELKDAPSSYEDQASKNVRVNEDETGVEFGGAYLDDGLDADKGDAGRKGRLYLATNTEILYEDDGTNWVERLRGESVTRLAELSERAHDSLTDVTSDQHHAEAHSLASHSGINIIDLIYPVGSIYISIVETNPGILFGVGTWVIFGEGRVPMGVVLETYPYGHPEATGGESSHILSVAEMPAHTHTVPFEHDIEGHGTDEETCAGSGTEVTGSVGLGQAHNNLQPFIVVVMWKRTA